jgi:hypothetical protein
MTGPDGSSAVASALRHPIALAAIALMAWAGVTWAFWVGYAGSDDLFYSRYAYLLHRPPMNWWEFRIPYVMSLRSAFLLFGPTEFVAAIPTLLGSLAIVASVAWMVGPDQGRDWKLWAAVALAITMPIDVGFRSVPAAPLFAAGILAGGTVCLLKGSGWVRILGSFLLACAFVTHEVSFFYIAALCLTALVVDPRRLAVPVLACVALSVIAVAVECAVYNQLLGDPFARYRTAAGTTHSLPAGYDPDTGISGVAFYLWPLQKLVLSKHFGFDLVLLLATGLICLKSLETNQRIVWVTSFLVFLWLGYGTQVPWAYKPFYRQFHYYSPLVFGAASLLPATLSLATRRQRVAQLVVALCVLSHLALTASGGRWGQRVDVSRLLLDHSSRNPQTWFVTDVATMNDMYVVGGFRLPLNVVCINGPAVTGWLMLNKEPANTPRFRFPEVHISGILVNVEGLAMQEIEPEFKTFLELNSSDTPRVVAPTRLKWIFRPLRSLLAPSNPPGWMVQSLGGAVIELERAGRREATPRTQDP